MKIKQLDNDLMAAELIREKGINIMSFIQRKNQGSFNYKDYKNSLSRDDFSLILLTSKEFNFIMKWLNNDK